MNLLLDKVIELNSCNDRDSLLSLGKKNIKKVANPFYIGPNLNVIYIYSLVDITIPYPKKNGKVLYIGEAKRADATGKRFSQHISNSSSTGSNNNGNYCLNCYYWGGYKLNLKIYDIGNITKSQRKDYESFLIKCHVKKYGSTPIAQGTSGKHYRVSHINELDETEINSIF
ncbi:hypothetical protein [Clostridium sp. UBA4548]|uniref:hypothetical protein n=1 Tax=Clostridium sp. UBA4548 TaxID=1946361 RepID=UPI0025C39288|nr:hypothetical protein [Clostridium sp. UBA4548]